MTNIAEYTAEYINSMMTNTSESCDYSDQQHKLVNARTSVTRLCDYQHHQSHKLMQIPHPPLQSYMDTTTNITEYVSTMMSQSIWRLCAIVQVTWIPPSLLQLCGCCHHYSRVMWLLLPLLLRYMKIITHFVVMRLPHPILSQLCEHHDNAWVTWVPSPATLQSEIITMTKVAELCHSLSEIYEKHHHHHCRVMQISHPQSHT